ncbi:flagellar hook assembly protein FlgD [Caulobacter mirabilis]|uniref:Basal-body rod modification protein FlgD n=1 Tax=Caulobacter mirabilis TaxID=69666 RepID=A0A2D2AV38_9CAUL|nr:flagellar hook assembly protein FlgD [Caulobacter mirabilis]ATQ41841.1 flagellar biosynthesis protein FlgD [Caulobacter mirabilis]
MAEVSGSGSVIDKITGSRNRMANNTQTFLKLLTTQLKNQDPLSPMDSTQFTAQITQMTGVEQQLITNDLLSMLVGMNDGGLAGTVDLIGKTVTVATDKAPLADGKAKWTYDLDRNAAKVKYEVLNSAGQVIYTTTKPSVKGGTGNTFEWDGKTDKGVQLANGDLYTLRISATGSGGEKIGTTTHTTGIATSVESKNGQNMVTIGKIQVPVGDVISVKPTAA